MKKSLKIPLIVFTVFIVLTALGIGAFFLLIEPDINILGAPELDTDNLTSYYRTVKILDKDGNSVTDALYGKNSAYVRIDELPAYVTQAFIAIEDKRFYSHSGIDYRRIAAAMLSNIKSGKFSEGASTITQQLIKNTHLSNEKTIKRKLNEMRLARKLERIYDKDDILESYLNILYFGSGIKGLGTASRIMFERSAAKLTLAQSAALASIINNPSKYNPYTNPEKLELRKNTVLGQMHLQGYITDTQYKNALSEKLIFSKNRRTGFIDALLKNACKHYKCTEKELFLNNFTFKTAYDAHIAAEACRAIKYSHAKNAATVRVLVLDNRTGMVVCDETNAARYTDDRRSPASAIKPFIAYAPALESGYSPIMQIADEPTDFGDYSPKNYKDRYRGYISMKEALAYSSNIAAVKLYELVGAERAKHIAEGFGITFSQTDGSPAVALGGMEYGITLTELANAYRTLANGGIYSPISYFKQDGLTGTRSTRAVGDDTAYLLTDMLLNCSRSGTAKRLKNCGYIAAKTGTNGDKNGNYDCYCIAYTPQNTIAVHIFAPANAPLDNAVTGASACDVIKQLCQSGAIDTSEPFKMPESVSYYEIDDLELRTCHEVYLADPLLPARYRRRVLLSNKNLPVRKQVDIIDFFDDYLCRDYEFYKNTDEN